LSNGLTSVTRRRALLATLAFALLAPLPVRADDADARKTVKKFYDWYLALPRHAWETHWHEVKALFDPVLFTRMQTALDREERERDEILDFDPFAAAQWDLQAYSLGQPVRSGDEVRVAITVLLNGNNGWNTHLVAVLRRSPSGAFAIYNFEYSNPTFNLRDDLEEALKAD